MRLTTDMGDWTTIPRRLRLALVLGLGTAVAIGIAAGVGMISTPIAMLVVLNTAVVIEWAFSLRRPWWPAEPNATAVVIDRNLWRDVALIAVLDLGAVVAAWVGIVRL